MKTDINSLIFIISQPRSGSTLLQALLSNNQTVGTVSEPWFLLPFLGYSNLSINQSKYNDKLALAGITDFKEKIGSQGFNEDLKSFFIQQYAKVLRDKETMVIDKTPRYYEILDEIVEFFPNAKIVILKRNPLAVLQSIITTWNVKNVNDLLDYKRDILIAPFKLQKFLDREQSNPNVIECKYETLVNYPSESLKILYDFIGISFTEKSLNYANNNKFMGTLGDPIGIFKDSIPNTKSLLEVKDLKTQAYWSEFYRGYAHFLGLEFLTVYGAYDAFVSELNPIKTRMFEIFYDRAQWGFREHEVPKWRLIKYAIQRRLGLLKY